MAPEMLVFVFTRGIVVPLQMTDCFDVDFADLIIRVRSGEEASRTLQHFLVGA